MSRPLADESAFRAVAHSTRRRILDLLRDGKRPVAELVSTFRLSNSAISQHLRILRTSGLVQQRRNGRQRVYELHPARLREIQQWIGLYDRLLGRGRTTG